MASPLPTGKQSVSLASASLSGSNSLRGSTAVRGSKIRRDPPPPVKKVSAADIEERDAWTVVIGIVTFALALVVIVIGVSNVAGWSPRQYTVEIRDNS